jgi:hypothetical protein
MLRQTWRTWLEKYLCHRSIVRYNDLFHLTGLEQMIAKIPPGNFSGREVTTASAAIIIEPHHEIRQRQHGNTRYHSRGKVRRHVSTTPTTSTASTARVLLMIGTRRLFCVFSSLFLI